MLGGQASPALPPWLHDPPAAGPGGVRDEGKAGGLREEQERPQRGCCVQLEPVHPLRAAGACALRAGGGQDEDIVQSAALSLSPANPVITLDAYHPCKAYMQRRHDLHLWPGHCGVHHAQAAVDGFLEEIIVRRELADNFCYVSSSARDRAISHCTHTVLMIAPRQDM